MKYKQISIEEIIKDFKAFCPKEQAISKFEKDLNQFLISAKKEDSEEYQKNEINKIF